MIFIIGCDFSPTSSSEQISDYEIIEMIRNAEKIEISIDELPSQSQANLQQEYIDYESLNNWKASGIGYLAELSGRGQRAGSFREVYFNMDGRKLEHINSEDEERPEGDGTDVECFELILPVKNPILTFEDLKIFFANSKCCLASISVGAINTA